MLQPTIKNSMFRQQTLFWRVMYLVKTFAHEYESLTDDFIMSPTGQQ